MAKADAVDPKVLLAYARRVAKYTLSPLDPNSWVIEPPIPQESHIRRSLLYQQDLKKAVTESANSESAGIKPEHIELVAVSESKPVKRSTDLLDLDFF